MKEILSTACKDKDFAEWAFGVQEWKDFMEYKIGPKDLMDAWNRRHGEKLVISEDDAIMDSMVKMKNIWGR